MINREKTKEAFGYDIDPNIRRRTNAEVSNTGLGINKKDLLVIDNCPHCGIERKIKWRQSSKNKPCLKCFHNLPEIIKAKQNQNKVKSEETKQKMRENHWSKKGIESTFKGKHHTKETIALLKEKATNQYSNMSEEDFMKHRISSSLQRGRTIKTFNGFTTPENTKIRQSPEGKAWTKEVLAKANYTCVKCNDRGGTLHAHHKNGFNLFPEQRFDLNNGVCLCDDCHEDFHARYGKGNNTLEQFQEWIAI